MKDEAELINQVLNGNKNAFGQLVYRYYPYCLEKAHKLLRDPELAKDLVQNAFIQAYFCLSNLKDKSLFKFWLFGIVKNVVKNHLKKTQQRYFSPESYYQFLREQEANKDLQYIAEIVLANVNALPDTYKDIVALFYYQDMGIKEIADACNLSMETVKVRLHRGRKILKEALHGYPELHQYHQTLQKKHSMKKVHIADIIMGGANKDRCSILLQDENNTSVFLIIITTEEAMAMVMALKNIAPPRPFVFNLMADLMQENKLKMDSMYIHDLVNGVFISSIKLQNGNKWKELDARPSDAITFALLFDSPIYVSQKILDQVGFPVPEKYKNTLSKERGIATLIAVIEDWEKSISSNQVKVKAKTEQEIQQAINRLIEFTFGDELIID